MSAFNMPEMHSKEFVLWQALLEKQTGLWLPESRKTFLVAALFRYMREKSVKDYHELYSKLSAGSISILDWASLVDSLTVHETSFYREKASLNFVISYCRDKALEKFKTQPDRPQHLQLWSVGCSTGEEVYSLAIELDKLNVGFKEAYRNSVYFGVAGVDISYPSLAVAREGIYLERQLNFVPQVTKNIYFDRLSDEYYQIKDHIRQRVCFIQGNIFDLKVKVKQEYDVIYCQNVLIYFKQEKKLEAISQLTKRLKPGGLLVLGHGEVTNMEGEELTRVENKHCLAYLRKGEVKRVAE